VHLEDAGANQKEDVARSAQEGRHNRRHHDLGNPDHAELAAGDDDADASIKNMAPR
jgi:hypothetical protein